MKNYLLPRNFAKEIKLYGSKTKKTRARCFNVDKKKDFDSSGNHLFCCVNLKRRHILYQELM